MPASAPAPTFVHRTRGLPSATWLYDIAGHRYGYVARFETACGKEDLLPLTWCVGGDGDTTSPDWRWVQWPSPRPLYVPSAALRSGLVPAVVVGDEQCAAAGHELLGDEFDFVSWPGGGKAWGKADWAWLRGRTVYLWPDCDAKRVPLNKVERDAGLDPTAKPIKPAHLQPGVLNMVSIGSTLQADHGCTVYLCSIPLPAAVAEGWSIASAIDEGWSADAVRQFIRCASGLPAVPPAACAAPAAASPRAARAAKAVNEPSEAPFVLEVGSEAPYWNFFNMACQRLLGDCQRWAQHVDLEQLLSQLGQARCDARLHRLHARELVALLRRLGWSETRSSRADSPRVFHPPQASHQARPAPASHRAYAGPVKRDSTAAALAQEPNRIWVRARGFAVPPM